MKNITIIFLLLLSSQQLIAQEIKEDLLNRYFEVTTDEKEAFFIRLSKLYNGLWAYTDYDGKQRIVQTGYYTDSNFTTKTGPYSFYWEGNLMYKGKYVNNQPSGYWYFFDKKGKLYDSLHYIVAAPVQKKSASDTIDVEEQKKTVTLYQEHLKKDTSNPFTKVDIEASFPGGDKGWSKYIVKQLSLPDLVMSLSKPQKYTVEVQFIVCSDGEICSVEAINSSHPLLDIMAVNAIRNGPKWSPASQNGRQVKAWRRQKISFIIPD